MPVSEFQLITETIRRFRTGYVKEFGAAAPDDLLYEAVSEGRRYPGMEHWLPLFHNSAGNACSIICRARRLRSSISPKTPRMSVSRKIADYYDARREALKDGVTPPYKPLPTDRLYLPETEWKERLATAALAKLTPFAVPDARADRCRRARRSQFHGRARRSRTAMCSRR